MRGLAHSAEIDQSLLSVQGASLTMLWLVRVWCISMWGSAHSADIGQSLVSKYLLIYFYHIYFTSTSLLLIFTSDPNLRLKFLYIGWVSSIMHVEWWDWFCLMSAAEQSCSVFSHHFEFSPPVNQTSSFCSTKGGFCLSVPVCTGMFCWTAIAQKKHRTLPLEATCLRGWCTANQRVDFLWQ